MSVPHPYGQIDGHCSTINNGTLYVMSSNGFQSLALKKKAQWHKEQNGVAVSGAACVQAGHGDEAALYVIGGAAKETSFGGLQRFSFASKKWETLSSASSDVIQQRTNHSVAYIPDAKSILVYAGSQPNAPSELSSQTFLISTESPYNIQSFTSKAPTTHLPILLPWNLSSAVMIGGSDYNAEVYLFNAQLGWYEYGTNLTEPPSGTARATILDTSDGGKVLELYDFSASPNTVSHIVLQGSDGQPAKTGMFLGNRSTSIRERQSGHSLTINNWPTYNGTEAPSASRPDCSISTTSSGLVVVAGGSAAVPVAIFDQRENSWLNADQFFDSKSIPHQPSSSSTPASTHTLMPSPTSTIQPTSTSAPTGTPHSLRLLGIILGVLCGIAAIFILVLLYFRHRRIKQQRKDGKEDEKGDGRMSFQDRGTSFMKETGGSMGNLQPPTSAFDRSPGATHNSLAIIAGKLGSKRNTPTHAQKSSFDSTANLVPEKDLAMGEPVEMMEIGEPNRTGPVAPTGAVAASAPKYGATLTVNDSDTKARRKRSSGWSKYFATSGPSGPNDLSHIPDAYVGTHLAEAPSSTQSKQTTPAHLIPPLDLGFDSTLDGQRLSHVATGSPSLSDSREDLAKFGSPTLAHEGQAGLIIDPSRPRSLSESLSSYTYSTRSTITSEYLNHQTGHAPWTPSSNTTYKDRSSGRRTSSMYSASVYEQRAPSRGRSAAGGGSFFPGAGTSYRPTRRPKTAASEVSIDDWPAPPTAAASKTSLVKPPTITPTGLPPPSNPLGNPGVLPAGTPAAYFAGAEKLPETPGKDPMGSDLTWLDLGNNHNHAPT